MAGSSKMKYRSTTCWLLLAEGWSQCLWISQASIPLWLPSCWARKRRHPVLPLTPSLAHLSDSSLSSLPTRTSTLTTLPSSLSRPSHPQSTPTSLRRFPSSASTSNLTPILSSIGSLSAHWITTASAGQDGSDSSVPPGRPSSLPNADDDSEEEES
jgi:hypothetical protein